MFNYSIKFMILILGHITPETRKEFFETEAWLKSKGFTVDNPAASIPKSYLSDNNYILRYYLQAIANCTHIYTLPNWHEMPNAALKKQIINALKIPCYD